MLYYKNCFDTHNTVINYCKFQSVFAFVEFYRFVRHKDKKEFDSVCKELTGEGCGYKPEDSVPKKRVQSEASNVSGNSCFVVCDRYKMTIV